MLDRQEIDIEIARLEYMDSSYPNYMKLVTLYAIADHMDKSGVQPPDLPDTSYGAAPVDDSSEFLGAIAGKDIHSVLLVIDELMDTLRVTNPRVYSSVLRKVSVL